MKKLTFTFLLLMSVCSMFASDFTVDGLNYSTLTDSTVQVSRGTYSGSITIPANVTYNNVSYSVTSIDDYSFTYCTGLTSINLPSSITSIGNAAFGGCNALTSVTIPSAITSIGDYAFSIWGIINVDTNNPNYTSQDGLLYNKNITKLIQCPLSKKGYFIIPASVTTIGVGAFEGCASLTSITIPSSVTSIGYYAFSRCMGLSSLAIPYSVISIGDGAFENCSGLINVESNNPNYTSQDGLLYNKTITTLIQCTISKKAKMTIPSSVSSIGNGAFYGCTDLSSIIIPFSVNSIGNFAFGGCSGLTSIYTYVTVPTILSDTYVFSDVNKTTCTLYVPIGLLSAYKNAAYWQDFVNIVEFDASAVSNPTNTTTKIIFNSATGTIQILGTDVPVQASIYNMNGMLVKCSVVSIGKSLPVQSLPKGIYVVKVVVNNEVMSQKVVI